MPPDPNISPEPEWMTLALQHGWTRPKIKRTPTDLDRFQRLHFASRDFERSAEYARAFHNLYLAPPLDSRHLPERVLRTAILCTLSITYMRPFLKSHGGWEVLDVRILEYDEQELELHGFLQSIRHRMLAHTDGQLHAATPMLGTTGGLQVTVKQPLIELSSGDITAIERMAIKASKIVRATADALGAVMAGTGMD
jgi:hypothetical protein